MSDDYLDDLREAQASVIRLVAEAQRWEVAHADMTLQARDALARVAALTNALARERLILAETRQGQDVVRDTYDAEIERLRSVIAEVRSGLIGLEYHYDNAVITTLIKRLDTAAGDL